jgi:AraC-like DNA-binding protein
MYRLLIPMTRATGLGPLPALFEERANVSALERLFAAEDLPLSVLDERKTAIPLVSLVGVYERAARVVGDRTFGWTVGLKMPHGQYGAWAEYSSQAPTLVAGICRAIRTIRYHQSGGGMTLDRARGRMIWRYLPPRIGSGQTQHSDHVIWPMISFCRAFLGADWMPDLIELNYRKDPQSHLLERELGCPIEFERPGVGIAIETGLLTAERPRPVRLRTLADVHAEAEALNHPEPLQSVIGIVLLRLLDGQTDVEGAAERLSMSVRSLQRLLQQHGLTYRDLLDRARMLRARSLLSETNRSITEIALALGYSDPPNFTRAFRRLAGRSPTEFRATLRGAA